MEPRGRCYGRVTSALSLSIGLTQNMSQLTRWMVGGPEVAHVINEFEEAENHVKKSANFRHHEQVRSVQASFVMEVKSLTNTIQDLGNPFADKSNNLLVLDTKDIVGNLVVSTVRTVKEVGRKQFMDCVEKRLVKRAEVVDKTIKRNNLALFDCPTKRKKTADQQLVSSLRKQCSLFSRLYVSCQLRGRDLEQFFRHGNESYPPSLSRYGELRTGTKSEILPCLEKCVQLSIVDTPEVDNIIFDGPAIVHLLKPSGSKTFGDYADKVFIPFITRQMFQS